MATIIDLTMPITEHFRWRNERKLIGDHAKGDLFQVTWIGGTVHGFTHVDAPIHMVPGGATTSAIALERLVGEAAVVDLTHVAANEPIDSDALAGAAMHVVEGDIVLLKTCWDERVSVHTPEFWTTAPYLTREACEWLRARQIKALGVDFPQDFVIRLLLDKIVRPIEEHVSHDVLLRNGVLLIEYLCNLRAVRGPRTYVYALPMKIPDADGAPARVIAIEG